MMRLIHVKVTEEGYLTLQELKKQYEVPSVSEVFRIMLRDAKRELIKEKFGYSGTSRADKPVRPKKQEEVITTLMSMSDHDLTSWLMNQKLIAAPLDLPPHGQKFVYETMTVLKDGDPPGWFEGRFLVSKRLDADGKTLEIANCGLLDEFLEAKSEEAPLLDPTDPLNK